MIFLYVLSCNWRQVDYSIDIIHSSVYYTVLCIISMITVGEKGVAGSGNPLQRWRCQGMVR